MWSHLCDTERLIPEQPLTRSQPAAHFIPLFASKAAPSMLLIDGAESEDLREFFEKHIVEQIDQDFEIKTSSEKADDVDEDELEEDDEDGVKPDLQEPIKLQIKHLKCHKSIRPKGGKGKGSYNWLFLCAHDRIVVEIPLDQGLGLKTLDDEYISQLKMYVESRRSGV